MGLFNRYETALQIVQSVCQLLGLERPSVAVSSSSTEILQLVAMLTAKGRELSESHQWQQFERRASVQIGPSAENGILLPDDWGGFISRTGWNETGDVRLIGPQDAVDWQAMKVTGIAGSSFNLRYRVYGGQVYFEDYPSDETAISFEYYSRGWAQDADVSETTLKDFCEKDSDIVLLDSLLMQYAVRLMWLESKGFATGAAQKDYENRFATVRSRDKDAPTLALSRRRGVRLLDAANIPETGFGQ